MLCCMPQNFTPGLWIISRCMQVQYCSVRIKISSTSTSQKPTRLRNYLGNYLTIFLTKLSLLLQIKCLFKYSLRIPNTFKNTVRECAMIIHVKNKAACDIALIQWPAQDHQRYCCRPIITPDFVQQYLISQRVRITKTKMFLECYQAPYILISEKVKQQYWSIEKTYNLIP